MPRRSGSSARKPEQVLAEIKTGKFAPVYILFGADSAAADELLKALREAEIGHCRFHDLRHTAASNLVRAGRTLFEVGTLLGHSSTTMTARYSHLAVHDTQAMVDSVMGELQ